MVDTVYISLYADITMLGIILLPETPRLQVQYKSLMSYWLAWNEGQFKRAWNVPKAAHQWCQV